MEFTIITYTSAHDSILDIINTTGVKSNKVVFKDYCNGEVLALTGYTRTSGDVRINIIKPTLDKDTMKDVIGRSCMVYYVNIVNKEDMQNLFEHFGHTHYQGYGQMPRTGIFDIKTCKPVCRELNAKYTGNIADLERLVLCHFKLSRNASTREFNRFHIIQQKREELSYLRIAHALGVDY
jgi:hypothetical protein